MTNRAAKGAKFERQLCRQLSLWFSEGKSDNWFWRTAGSGARATVRGKKGHEAKRHCGDIAAIDPAGQALLDVVTIEVKRGYNKFTIQDLLDHAKPGAVSLYAKWIAKIQQDAARAGSLSWLLIIKRDLREPLVLYPDKLEQCFEADCRVTLGIELHRATCEILLPFFGDFVYVHALKDFLECVPPDVIRKMAEGKL